jgi:hypothetical protein
VGQLRAAERGGRVTARDTRLEKTAVEGNASGASKRRRDASREATEEATGQPTMIVDDDAKRVLVQV